MRRDGSYPEVLTNFERMGANVVRTAEQMKQTPLRARYPDFDRAVDFTEIGDTVATILPSPSFPGANP
jgi:hypothetical protein